MQQRMMEETTTSITRNNMLETFKTYNRKTQSIKPEDNVFMMYLQDGNTWVFKGLVSRKAKEYIQSDDHLTDLNKKFENEVILASFTKKELKSSKKIYLFLPCNSAEVVTYYPIFENSEIST